MSELIRIDLCEGAEMMIEVTPQMVRDLRQCNEEDIEVIRTCRNCSWQGKIFSIFTGEDIALCGCEPVTKAVLER